jgi:hypothetical protein
MLISAQAIAEPATQGANWGSQKFMSQGPHRVANGRHARGHDHNFGRGRAHYHQGKFRSARRGDGFRNWPLYGYADTAPYYAPDYFEDAPVQIFVAPPEPPRSLDCTRSQTTVIVVSEDGGTRQIAVTRC